MKRPAQILLFAIVVVVAAVGGFLLSGPPRPGQIDADRLLAASLPDLSGTPQTIGNWKGKVLVVNFWATWCPPCLEEIPIFVRLQRQMGEQGLQFVGIAVDKHDKVAAFVRENGVNYPVMIGQLDAIELAESAGNTSGGLPYTLVFDREGRIVSRHAGAMTEQELKPIIADLL
ncbi:MAG: TlpA disulfide reductase family protein [Burkholderiales bacterium]|jgi:thiol-disulfide isomerase/thioredoxin